MFLDVGMCYLLNLAFLITWYCRIAEIEPGGMEEWEGVYVYVFMSFWVMLIVIMMGGVFFHFYLKN